MAFKVANVATAKTANPETPAPPPPPSFLKKTWPLLLFAGGVALMAGALGFWRGPMRQSHNQKAADDFAEGKRLFQQKEWWPAIARLNSVESRIWRIPERASEVAFMLGVANNALAERADLDQAAQYRRAAISYLRNAAQLGVPEDERAALEEELASAYIAIRSFSDANNSLEESLRRRERLAGVIDRRSAQALARIDPPNENLLKSMVEQWASRKGLPSDEADPAAAALALASEGKFDELRAMLDDPNTRWLRAPVDPEFRNVDLTAATILDVEGPVRALEFLHDAAQRNNLATSRLYGLLARSHVERDPPDFAAALEAGQNRLRLEDLPPTEIERAREQLAVVLIENGQPIQARRLLAQVQPGVVSPGLSAFLIGRTHFEQAEILSRMTVDQWVRAGGAAGLLRPWHNSLLRALAPEGTLGFLPEFLRVQATEQADLANVKRLIARANYLEAINYFQQAPRDKTIEDERLLGRALVFMGSAYRAVGRPRAAVETLDRVIDGFPKSPLAAAAHFLRAESLLDADDPEAVQAFKQATRVAIEEKTVPSSMLTLPRLRGMFIDGWRKYRDAGNQGAAIELARLFEPFAPAGDAERMRAESGKRWGDSLTARAAGEDYPVAQKTLAEARAHYRAAASDYAASAAADKAHPDFVETLWQATLCSYLGHDFAATITRGEAFLETHANGPLDFAGDILLARAMMGLGRFADARTVLELAIEKHPRQLNRFEGRILLSQCLVELARPLEDAPADSKQGEERRELLTQAEASLLRNTDGTDLEPTSGDWQRSLFALGSLYHEMARYDEAIERLDEAMRRFPDSEFLSDAMFRVADSYQRSARRPLDLLASEGSPRGRDYYRQEARRRLGAAQELHGRLARRLAGFQEQRTLAPDEAVLLRTAYFRMGEVAMALEDWPAAINAYTTAASRFQNRPDCLAAYVEIANAYWKIDKPRDALSTLRQARWVLGQLDDEAFRDSALSRNQWMARLETLIGGP